MNQNLRVLLLLVAAPAMGVVRADPPPVAPEQADFFEKRVRPVLIEHCHGCHGEKKQEGGLRLDSRTAVLKGGDSGAVVLPGRPEESDLIDAIRYDGALRMPPRQQLPPDAVAALTEWVRQGAPWPQAGSGDDARRQSAASQAHWAYQPVRKAAPPAVRDSRGAPTDLDRFIQARLEEQGMSPAPEADRRTLIRRATFDLVGLPPAPEEVAAFESDARPTAEAFAVVIDRLLDSPHYGERWGRHWLDVARYADNKGYVFFEEQAYPWSYTFRDWVIRAFNEDLPWDRFVMQQLAADQLPDPEPASLAALGFLTIGGHFMNNVHDIFDDRIDVVTRGLLGLTVTCARCHDHKYDPIPATDYYGLYGVFRSASEPVVPPRLGPVPETELFEHYELGLFARRRALESFLAAKYDELVSGARTRVAEYLLAAHASRDQPSTEDFMLLIPKGDVHPIVVQRYWLLLARTRRSPDPVWSVWHALAGIPEAEFAASAAAVCAELAARHDPARPLNRLVVEAVCQPPPGSMKEVAERYSELLNRIDGQRRGLAEAAGAATVSSTQTAQTRDSPTQGRGGEGERGRDEPGGEGGDVDEEALWLAFHGPDAPANVPQVAGWGVLTLLPDREAQEEYQKLLKPLEQWLSHGPHAPPRAMVLTDEPVPYEPRVFLRGNPNRAGEAAPRRFPRFLAPDAPPFSSGSGRLELARAIVDPANPLAARVFVNRVWQHHFGTGLVRTPSDFGVRSDPPSHPELLDWLAATFIEQGWSVKRLHRLIMNTAVYRRAADGVMENAESLPASGDMLPQADAQRAPNPQSEIRNPQSPDPDNRLLARFPRRRLDFEALRDALLAAAGILDRTVGGPPAALAGSRRRTVYGFIDRHALPALLRTFDFPSPDSTSPRRDETTVAPQALYLMNGPLTQECARQLLARPDVAGEPDAARRVERMHRLLFARGATAREQSLAAEYLGPAPDAPTWQRYAHSLLLTNEFAFID